MCGDLNRHKMYHDVEVEFTVLFLKILDVFNTNIQSIILNHNLPKEALKK